MPETQIITVDDLKNLMGELRGMAHALLLSEGNPQSLTPTALAVSALRRAKVAAMEWEEMRWENRAHFFAALRMAMEHALIDHARRAKARGRDRIVYMAWDETVLRDLSDGADRWPDLFIALDEALAILKASDSRLAEVIAQFYYAGFTVPEMARFSEVNEKTVDRELKRARTVLKRIMEQTVCRC